MSDTLDRLVNLAKGNGYRTVYDLFEDAYQGRLSGKRKNVNYEAELATILEEKFNKGDWENLTKEDLAAFDRYSKRFLTNYEWQNDVTQALEKHRWFYQKQIDALKKQAMAGGC